MSTKRASVSATRGVSPAPAPIRRLDERTVSRIAAGEVVQRPAAAVKELVENCIDAGATSIQVTVKNGGISLIQIQDNGCGIRKDDLNIVCERFTTSKLSDFEDLRSIRTFGFRGEALSSIAHVSRLTITTKTADSPCAFRAAYEDGRLVAARGGAAGGAASAGAAARSVEPEPCAGVNGTIISVENLFYNMLARREAFKNPNEEYQRILDVVSKYSIHYASSNVSFTCRKQGQTTPDLHALAGAKTIDNIRQVFGAGLCKELVPVSVRVDLPPGHQQQQQQDGGGGDACSLSGYVSSANYSMKRSTYIFFINNRLVDCGPLKRLLDSIYSEVLPKGGAPFAYLALALPPASLDVNVHPTKKEVIFLHENIILDQLYKALVNIFESSNQSRTFVASQVVCLPSAPGRPGAPQSPPPPPSNEDSSAEAQSTEPIYTSDVTPRTTHMLVQSSSQLLDEATKRVPNDDDDEEEEEEAEDENEEDGEDGESLRRSNENISNSSKRKRIVSHYDARQATQSSSSSGPSRRVATVAPNKLIRTDPSLQRIDHCFPVAQAVKPPIALLCGDVTSIKFCSCCNVDEGSCVGDRAAAISGPEVGTRGAGTDGIRGDVPTAAAVQTHFLPRLVNTKCQLLSITELISEISASVHSGIADIISSISYVGPVDSAFILVQYKTKLLLLEFPVFLRDMFYQLTIRQFAELACARFSSPLSIRGLILIALENQCPPEQLSSKQKFSDNIVALLMGHREMLSEYFSIEISEDAMLHGLPELIAGYSPQQSLLPNFLLELATKVNWEEELTCFRGIADRLADYYSVLALDGITNPSSTVRPPILSRDSMILLERVLLPALKKYLLPQRGSEDCIIELESLENMYKIFERC